MFSHTVRWSHLTRRKCSIRQAFACSKINEEVVFMSGFISLCFILFRSGYLFWCAANAKCYTTNNYQPRITMETSTNSRCRKSSARSHSSYWWCRQCIPFQVSVNVKYNYIHQLCIVSLHLLNEFYGNLTMISRISEKSLLRFISIFFLQIQFYFQHRSSDEVLHILSSILCAVQRARISLIIPKKKPIDELMKSRNMVNSNLEL